MRPIPVVLIACLALSLLSCKKEWRGEGEEELLSITVDGYDREYRVYVPPSYDGSKAYPVIFTLHGRGGTARGMDKFSGMNPVADDMDFIVVYPQGYGRSWHDDRDYGPAFDEGIDDIQFFNELLDQIENDYVIDTNRLYACGMSNGGFMSMSLACNLSNRIAAVATVTGIMALDPISYCSDAQPTAIMLIGGTGDPIVPYEGGEISDDGSSTIGFEEAFEFWRDQNNCLDEVILEDWADQDSDDGTTVTTHRHTACDSSVTVILYEVNEMGHTWPEGQQYLREKHIGKVSQEFNGAQEIATFLLQFELK